MTLYYNNIWRPPIMLRPGTAAPLNMALLPTVGFLHAILASNLNFYVYYKIHVYTKHIQLCSNKIESQEKHWKIKIIIKNSLL